MVIQNMNRVIIINNTMNSKRIIIAKHKNDNTNHTFVSGGKCNSAR